MLAPVPPFPESTVRLPGKQGCQISNVLFKQPEVVHMRHMRTSVIDAFGDAVRMLDLSAPSSPAPDEVVISVRAAGVGNWDEIVRVGDWDVGHRPPLALGVEAAGIVDAVGEDV